MALEFDSPSLAQTWRTEFFENNVQHFAEENFALASDVGDVVKCLSEVVTDLRDLQPFCHGSSSGGPFEFADAPSNDGFRKRCNADAEFFRRNVSGAIEFDDRYAAEPTRNRRRVIFRPVSRSAPRRDNGSRLQLR